MNELIRKLSSRKFWISIAAFLSSVGASIAGFTAGNEKVATIGTICAVISAAIYAACEAYVDGHNTNQDKN